jgi:ubiquinone/menaquinone biosynthesis C-methylase UbiE
MNEARVQPDPAFSEWQAEYFRHISAQDSTQRVKRRTYDLLDAQRGAHLLDVGCGLGDDVLALADIVGSTGRVVGIDHDPDLLRRARAKAVPSHVEFIEAEAHRMPLPDASFDGVRVERVLQHVAGPDAVVAEVARVLRLGGRATILEPDWGTYAVDLPNRELARRVLDARTDAYASGWAGRQLHRLLHDSGFASVHIDLVPVLSTDFEQSNRVIDLPHAHTPGVARGVLSEEDAARWVEMITVVRARPTFFSVILMVLASGARGA